MNTGLVEFAHSTVLHAIKLGTLAPLDGTVPCADCGSPATDYDHRDYAKPLEVVPVCHSCNAKRGPALNHHLQKSETAVVYPSYGEELRKWRELLGASTRDVAVAVGVTHTTIQNAEASGTTEEMFQRVKLALMRIAVQRIKAGTDVIMELTA